MRNHPNVVLKTISGRPIDPGRWNYLLGEKKTTVHTSMPNTGLSAIFTDGKVRALSIADSENYGDTTIVWTGQIEIIYG